MTQDDAARHFQLGEADAYHWQGEDGTMLPVPKVSRVPLAMLKGIDHVRDLLLANSEQFEQDPSHIVRSRRNQIPFGHLGHPFQPTAPHAAPVGDVDARPRFLIEDRSGGAGACSTD